MKMRDLKLPIVNQNWMQAKVQQPWRVVSDDVLARWDEATAQLLPYQQGRGRHLLKQLDTLMLLTGTSLPAQITGGTFVQFDQRLKQLAGALFSTHFCHAKSSNSRATAHTLSQIRRRLAEEVGTPCTWHIPVSSTKSSDLVQKLVSLVDELEIQAHLVNECRGWACVRKDDSIAYHKLSPVVDKFGYDFANALFEVCESYHLQRRRSTCFGIDVLGAFVGSIDNPPPIEQLKNPEYTTIFFGKVFEYWMTSSQLEGLERPLEHLVETWRGDISCFFNEHIFPSGLIAAPSGGLPCPRNISSSRRETNIRQAETGEVYEKLLTEIPMEISEDQAFELIFASVKTDLKQAKDWAMAEVKRKAELLERRKQLAKVGTPRQIHPRGNRLVDRGGRTEWSAADHLANASATFEHLGYPCYSDNSTLSSLLFPSPLTRWAEELAVPTSGYLIPHCAVIISEHPAVTPSFLENHELFDSDGRMVGLVKTDTGHVLIGTKFRRGAKLATQEIHLNESSYFAVDQIIRLTEPLRAFLRKQKSDDCKYLLLSSSKGFGYPTRVNNLSALTSTQFGVRALEASFSRVLKLPTNAAKEFARRFSLSSLRASAAVQVYFETRSVQAMATTLGHAKYDATLLQRYLPTPIRMFFEERWVRIFQVGIIVEALVGSKYQLEASGFGSLDELDSFLANHALRMPPPAQSERASSCSEGWDIGDLSSHREAIFGLNTEILTTLLSLELAQANIERDMRPKAQYWASISRDLIPYVERAALNRPDIQQFLVEAKTKASPTLVENLAYA